MRYPKMKVKCRRFGQIRISACNAHRVPQLPGLVNLVAAQAKVGRRWGANLVGLHNEVVSDTRLADLAPRLRRIVFVGQAHQRKGVGGRVSRSAPSFASARLPGVLSRAALPKRGMQPRRDGVMALTV